MFGTILAYGGRFDEAISELQEARRLAPGLLPVMGSLGYALAGAGREREARELMAQLGRGDRPGVLPAKAKILTALGNQDAALRAFNLAVDAQ
ncbi:MAG: tetratricopeptide repeat protein [Gemmatimonadaceae bacterium]